MEQFMEEHGGIIVSGIISIITLGLMLMTVMAAGNMEVSSLAAIMGA